MLRPTAFLALVFFALTGSPAGAFAQSASGSFRVEETSIAKIQEAILAHKTTATEVVKLYLARIKAYNGTDVLEPEGLLGPVQPIANSKTIDALITLNLRPAARKQWGFDDRKARSMTDSADADPKMPDALEVAAAEDAAFAKSGRLVGPLHGVVVAIKDQYDTFDMRTTSGADAFYANDRPPHDATFAERLRAAGAIVIGKANMGEYAAGYRTAFGGTEANPYDTTRTPGGSSGGSGMSVAANFATVAIAEETGPSVRFPSRSNNAVGISPTQELVSRHGMINTGINTRVGPIARNVEDAARILTVIAGYDPKDELTAFSVGRMPDKPYESFTHEKSLAGMRIGVVREYMDKSLFTKADEQSIDLVDKAIEDLKRLGADIVDPGEHGELFTKYIRKYGPMLQNALYAKTHAKQFPVDDEGKPTTDQVKTFVELYMDPSKAEGHFTLRDLGGNEFGGGGYGGAGGAAAVGESKFGYDLYLAERADANIHTLDDLINKANFFKDPNQMDKKATLISANKPTTYETAGRMQRRFAVQQIILAAFADLKLDAVVYPTGNIPPPKIGAPNEPTVNGRTTTWTFLGQQGFPAITVPAGFTTESYDRIRDPNAPPPKAGGRRGGGGGGGDEGPAEATILVGPTPAKLPVGVDFLGRPFSEPVLLKIAAAYEQATHHRMPPPLFGPLQGN